MSDKKFSNVTMSKLLHEAEKRLYWLGAETIPVQDLLSGNVKKSSEKYSPLSDFDRKVIECASEHGLPFYLIKQNTKFGARTLVLIVKNLKSYAFDWVKLGNGIQTDYAVWDGDDPENGKIEEHFIVEKENRLIAKDSIEDFFDYTTENRKKGIVVYDGNVILPTGEVL